MMDKVGFVLSHPFQYQFFKPIAAQLERSYFIIETRPETPFDFSDEFLSSLPGEVVQIESSKLKKVDGRVDVLFCMTPVHVMALFKETKTICLQYSLAKEVYQHGAWRCLADLNIMQGEYSFEKVKGFCVAEIGGNPRYDSALSLPRGGRGLLYMPTYGDLSSLEYFEKAVDSLPVDMEIRLKSHHASEFTDAPVIQRLKANSRVQFLDGYTDAIEEIASADVVLSDYSGAIFDALALSRPVALIQPEVVQTKLRTEGRSLEIARAEQIGPIAREANEIASVISLALESRRQYEQYNRQLLDSAVSFQGQSAVRIAHVLERFLSGDYRADIVQESIRSSQRGYISQIRKLKRAAKKSSFRKFLDEIKRSASRIRETFSR